MEAKDKIAKETDDNIQRVYQNCELLTKYFDLLDKRLIRSKVEKRIILPYMDLETIIGDEIITYYKFIIDDNKSSFTQIALTVVEIFLLRMVKNDENYPSENEMENIINQIGKDYNYDSNKLLSEIFADYLRVEKYSKIFKQINDKLGIIIFNQKKVFSDYILKMLYVENLFSEKESSNFEKEVLNILKKHNNYFNIPDKFFNNLENISDYLSTCDKMNFNYKKKKNNDLKDREENTLKTEEKKDIKNENEIILRQQVNKKEEHSNDKVSALEKKIEEMEIKLNEQQANHNSEIAKINENFKKMKEKNINLRENQINLKRRIDNLEDKLFKIQSRDIWKKIVNYNLYHLGIEKSGDYDDRIENIICEIRSFKNSDVYIRFFKDIKNVINKGDSLAHTFEKQLPYGFNKSYLDLLFNSLSLPNVAYSEIKIVKKILKEIKAEDMIVRFLSGEKIIDTNVKIDLKKILADL